MWRNCKDKHERLRWAREAAGYTSAADAVRALGVVQATYNANENGNRTFGLKAAKKYAKCFKVSWDWLYFGHGSPHDKPWKAALHAHNPQLADLVDRLIYLPDTKVNAIVQMIDQALSLGADTPETAQPVNEQVGLTAPISRRPARKLASG